MRYNKSNNILCTICARGGSKGVNNKALKKINGKHLIEITIKQALASKVFDEIVVSTDSKKIQKIAVKRGVKCWFLRSKKLSSDKSPKVPVIRDALLRAEHKFKPVIVKSCQRRVLIFANAMALRSEAQGAWDLVPRLEHVQQAYLSRKRLLHF